MPKEGFCSKNSQPFSFPLLLPSRIRIPSRAAQEFYLPPKLFYPFLYFDLCEFVKNQEFHPLCFHSKKTVSRNRGKKERGGGNEMDFTKI